MEGAQTLGGETLSDGVKAHEGCGLTTAAGGVYTGWTVLICATSNVLGNFYSPNIIQSNQIPGPGDVQPTPFFL